MTIDKNELADLAAELRDAYFSHDAHLPFDEQQSMTVFDLRGFDTRLAIALGIETPDDYAQRKAEEEDLAMPVSPLDPYSVGRKLVSMLGAGWTWTVADSGTSSLASVLGTEVGFIENHLIGPVALRIAALDALAAQ